MNFVKGEIVTRKSYDNDLLFKIIQIKDDQAILHGIDYRLEADAPVDDLVRVDDKELRERDKTGKDNYRTKRSNYTFL